MLEEVYTVRALLDAAENGLDGVRVPDIHLHPWLAVAATAAERYVKLVLGLARLDQTGAWPGEEILQAKHWMVETEATTRRIVTEQLDRATGKRYIGGLLTAVNADPWITPLLEVLQAFAVGGRYEHLDAIAGSTPKHTPKARFERLEQAVMETHPAHPSGDLDGLLEHRNTTLRASLRQWRNLYGYAMAHQVLGSEAKRFGLAFVVR